MRPLFRLAFYLCSAVPVIALTPVPRQVFAKNIIIFAPHPDDEAIMASGIVYSAIKNGDSVTVVVVTNGDIPGVSTGYAREGETVSGMGVLGLSESSVVFLGYGDRSLMPIYNSQSNPTLVLTSPAGQTHTYGNRGLGRIDFHSYLFGVPGDYNRKTIHDDIKAVLTLFSPDDVYVTSNYDDHPDHKATNLFVAEALVELKQQGSSLSVRVHETIVHPPCPTCDPNAAGWPGGLPATPFDKPPNLDPTPLSWNGIESVPVPAPMQISDLASNLKYQAMTQYQTEPLWFLSLYVKSNEFFWLRDFGANLALSSSVSVSSERPATGQLGIKAVDGIVDGYTTVNYTSAESPYAIAPGDYTKEWATNGELAGAWIKLTWGNPVTVSKVILHDRMNLVDNILAGTLFFSDGSSVPVGALPNNGVGLEVPFPSRTVTWMQFRVDKAYGANIGLAEIEVLGTSIPLAVTLAGLTLSPSSLVGGGSSQATVTLNGLAPAAGAVVTLSSGNASVATVPSTVTVPAGSNSAVFTVTTNPVTVLSTLTISASYGGVTKTAILSVAPAPPTGAPANLAGSATVSVSSERPATGQLGIKAIDGIVDGYPGDYTKEWATNGELAGAWIKLTWSNPVTVSQVILHDRPNLVDNVLAGTLFFSDGSSVAVGALPNNGAGLAVLFPSKTITWLQFRVDSAVGANIGLAEIEVF